MYTPAEIDSLDKRRNRLLTEMATIGELRPGSLTERYRKCGKPSCHCASETTGGHGPSFSLTRQVKGKTVTRVIPATAVADTRAQLAECQRFRTLSAELIEVSERLCDARLKHRSTFTAKAEKGGSEKRSKRKSRPRSGV